MDQDFAFQSSPGLAVHLPKAGALADDVIGNASSIDVLAVPDAEDIAFEPQRMVIHQRPADLS
ncbi:MULTISPECIES: hypothetical protein [unclassified Pseudomonas]|uniref:hypothetical protein n=1 Tax=unclassified Pseudomonas TaxID=196821 RepID=UPI00200FAA64|nr:MULTISPECIES: hypothetical protein [unclassified Pseudomonas]